RAPSFENVPARTSTWLLRDLSSPSLYFFFQAEDGIRDRNVTGVQTCALPIWPCRCCWRRPTATRYRSPTCPASAPTCPFGPVTWSAGNYAEAVYRGVRTSTCARAAGDGSNRWPPVGSLPTPSRDPCPAHRPPPGRTPRLRCGRT